MQGLILVFVVEDNKIFCFLELEVLNIRRKQISKCKLNIESCRGFDLPSKSLSKSPHMYMDQEGLIDPLLTLKFVKNNPIVLFDFNFVFDT